MKIKELAQVSKFSLSTLYDYLRSGLLPSPEKKSPTKAFFNMDHVMRLKEIRHLKNQGLSMADIKARLISPGHKEVEPRESVDEIRLAIIDKALELFSIHHYENTKISDITQALNMGNGTFYRYFKSKEELFLDCLERLPKVLVPRDAWAEVEKETDYIKRLKKRGYAMLNAFPSYIGILNYAKLALGGTDEVLARKAAECIRSLVRPLEKELSQAIAHGHVREVDAQMCAYLLLGINETFGYLLLMDPDSSVEKGFGVIEDFIGHALMPPEIKTKGGGFLVELTDFKGNMIEIDDFACGAGDFIPGHYLEGELHVSFHDILLVVMEFSGDRIALNVELKNKERLCMSISPETGFSGRTARGQFFIRGDKVKQIRFITGN